MIDMNAFCSSTHFSIRIHLHDWHRFRRNTSIRMNLFENFVNVNRIGFLSSTFLFFFSFVSAWSFAGFGHSFLWTFWGCLSFWWHCSFVSNRMYTQWYVKLMWIDCCIYSPNQWQHLWANENISYSDSDWLKVAQGLDDVYNERGHVCS